MHVVPFSATGGTAGFIQRQVDGLTEAGVDGRLVFFGGSALLSSPRRVPAAIGGIRRAIVGARPDLVHAHWGSGLALSAALASLAGPPLVISYRGSDLNPTPSEPRACSIVRVGCSQLAALRAAAIICVSEGLRQRLWVHRRRAVVIPDGTDLSLFRPMDRREARRLLGWPEHDRVVLFHEGGRPLVKRRDLADASVRESMRCLAGVRLHVLGTGVPHSEVALLLNAADCVLVTSDYEGSPNIVREALACNTPVVSVDVGDVRRWLDGLEGMHVVPRDPVILGTTLANALATGVRPSGRARAEQFSAEGSRASVLSVYSQVSRGRRGR